MFFIQSILYKRFHKSSGYYVFSRHSFTVCSHNELHICSSKACELPLHYRFIIYVCEFCCFFVNLQKVLIDSCVLWQDSGFLQQVYIYCSTDCHSYCYFSLPPSIKGIRYHRWYLYKNSRAGGLITIFISKSILFL